MSKTIQVNWQQQRSFLATSPDGGSALIDGAHTGGALGPSEMLLAALGGCMSTTVIGVLEKKRQQVMNFAVELIGEQMPDWPKSYTSIHILYRVTGINLDTAAVERAVELAETKYCTVSGSLKATVTHAIEIVEVIDSPSI